MAFYVGGVNYLTKMSTDLAFLPAPSAQDPLLLHWFSDQLPWLLSHSDPLAEACMDVRLMAPFGARSVNEGGSPDGVAQLAQAQKELLEESARNGTLCAPAHLQSLAAPPPPTGYDDEVLDAGVRWQWAALQTLLYGSEAYRSLLAALPAWFANNELEEAAMVVQQQYRNRLTRKLSRVKRQATDRKYMMDRIAQAKSVWRSSATLQAQWRGFLVRRALKEAAIEHKNEDQRKRTAQELELQKFKQNQDQRQEEERAAHYIQQRWKVKCARKQAKQKKLNMEQRNTSASMLLAQTQGVALLEKVLTRHRACNSVMWETYSVVCLTYEVDRCVTRQSVWSCVHASMHLPWRLRCRHSRLTPHFSLLTSASPLLTPHVCLPTSASPPPHVPLPTCLSPRASPLSRLTPTSPRAPPLAGSRPSRPSSARPSSSNRCRRASPRWSPRSTNRKSRRVLSWSGLPRRNWG